MAKRVGNHGVDALNGHQAQPDISGKVVTSDASVRDTSEVIVVLCQTIAQFYLKEVRSINANATVLDPLCPMGKKSGAVCSGYNERQRHF
ncbi:unnamed protein product [Rotaria socialis]|uniref:Uncharacterized protein n=1 Tax=Rotaria socialis TaxID=392032 RepID=A0A818BEC3_9BILA|nr:unnamed protein product [Rotaria socialis]CAF4450435.1 unnamed protein product [Rotaria socialis]